MGRSFHYHKTDHLSCKKFSCFINPKTDIALDALGLYLEWLALSACNQFLADKYRFCFLSAKVIKAKQFYLVRKLEQSETLALAHLKL